MSNYDMSIHTNPDAMAWVKFFRQMQPDCNVPDDVMLGWFANAMMAMHDHMSNVGNGRITWRDTVSPYAECAHIWGAELVPFLGKTVIITVTPAPEVNA